MRIFVAGATGVIGRRVVPQLVATGHQVTAVGRTPAARARLQQQGASPVDLNLLEPADVRPIVTDHDVVINLATHMPSSSVRLFLPVAWRENDRLRRFASATLVDAALAGGVQRVIQESVAFVYADGGDRWIDERAPLRTARHTRSALDAEQAAQRFTEAGRLGVVLRFGAFYGADAAQTLDAIRFVTRGWSPLPGDSESFFSSVSHDDAARGVAAGLTIPAGIHNVVDNEPVRRREYVNALAEGMGVAHPKLLPAWTTRLLGPVGETIARSLRLSNRKFRSACDWEPNYPSVRDGWPAVIKTLRRGAPEAV
jgi:nucleoside-diphosphate-sugar epimerase